MRKLSLVGVCRVKKAFCIICAVTIVLSGCSIPGISIKADNMVPFDLGTSHPHRGKTLKLAHVNGGTELPAFCCTYDEVKIDNATFEKALLLTLRKSGLFRDVVTESANADYELVADIGSQENNMVGVLTYSTTLLVNYSLIDKTTNKEIWREHIFSDDTEEGSFSKNQVALERLNENAAKKNLTQFMTKFAAFMTSHLSNNIVEQISIPTDKK